MDCWPKRPAPAPGRTLVERVLQARFSVASLVGGSRLSGLPERVLIHWHRFCPPPSGKRAHLDRRVLAAFLPSPVRVHSLRAKTQALVKQSRMDQAVHAATALNKSDKMAQRLRAGVVGAALAVVTGLLFLSAVLGQRLADLSFALPSRRDR